MSGDSVAMGAACPPGTAQEVLGRRPSDLMRLPVAERDVILREAAERAAEDPEYVALLEELG